MTELNNLDIVILIMVGISGLIALSRGLIKEVLSIIGWVLSGFAVVWLLPVFTKITRQYINSGLISGSVSAVFILILFMVIWIIVTDNVVSKIRNSKLSGLDRILGLFFGIMRAFLLIVLVYILISWCMPEKSQPEFMQKSKYFQIAGSFAKPIESLIPQETLDVIKSKTDAYIAEKEPWKQVKEGGDKKDAALTLKTAVNIIVMCAVLSSPFIPATSEKIFASFGIKDEEKMWPADIAKTLTLLETGRTIEAPGILFAKILPEKIEELKAQFGDEKNAVKQKGKELHI